MKVPSAAHRVINQLLVSVRRFAVHVSGATAIEYGLIAGLIGIAIVTSVTYFGSQLSGQWIYISGIVVPQLAH